MGRFFKHPIAVLTEQPVNILIVCIPLSLVVFIGGFISMVKMYGITVLFTSTVIDDFAVLAVLISIIPVAILDFREQKRIQNLEDALPNFFRDLAGMNDSGMTLPNAVHLVAGAEYGTLTPHIRKLDNEMSWGVGFVEGMYRFGKNLGTPLADRSVDLIAKASKAGGDISEVLRAMQTIRSRWSTLPRTPEQYADLRDHRDSLVYGIPLCHRSSREFLFEDHGDGGHSGTDDGSEQQVHVANRPPCIQTAVFPCSDDQGFFSGLCAGQMGEGRVVAGQNMRRSC